MWAPSAPTAPFRSCSASTSAPAGRGGAVFSRSEELYWRARRAADRGKPLGLPQQPGRGGNVLAALNCNMDELGAAIARAQLKKLPSIVARRRAFVELLKAKGLGELGTISIPDVPANVEHSYWWLRLGIDLKRLTCSRKEYFDALVAEGVPGFTDYWFARPAIGP